MTNSEDNIPDHIKEMYEDLVDLLTDNNQDYKGTNDEQ